MSNNNITYIVLSLFLFTNSVLAQDTSQQNKTCNADIRIFELSVIDSHPILDFKERQALQQTSNVVRKNNCIVPLTQRKYNYTDYVMLFTLNLIRQ